MRPILVIALYMVGVVCAFAAVVAIFGAQFGDTIIFGAVAWACWEGVTRLTANPYA